MATKVRKKPVFFTKAEDQVIIDCVAAYPNNLQQAFRVAKTQLPQRSVQSIEHRWYTHLRDGSLIITTGSKEGFSHNVKNVPIDKNGDMPDQGLSSFQTIVKIMLNDPKIRTQVLAFFNGPAPKVDRTVVHVNS